MNNPKMTADRLIDCPNCKNDTRATSDVCRLCNGRGVIDPSDPKYIGYVIGCGKGAVNAINAIADRLG